MKHACDLVGLRARDGHRRDHRALDERVAVILDSEKVHAAALQEFARVFEQIPKGICARTNS